MLYNARLACCFILLFFVAWGCNNNAEKHSEEAALEVLVTPVINYAVKQSFPHDAALFTEGLLVHNGQLFESTGSPQNLPLAKFMICVINLLTGKFDEKITLDKMYFGEGIVFLNNTLYELTYKNKVGSVYDAATYKKLDSFTYENAEGWSLTTDGKRLIMSDGTAVLTYLDPIKLKPSRQLNVTENGQPRDSLNELEYIKDYLYANIWQNNSIVKIDTATGKVVGKHDLSSLTFEAKNRNPAADVLNGIAYDSVTDKIHVTGKLWANIYQVAFAH